MGGKTSVRFLISTWGWVLLLWGFCPGTVGVSAWGGSGHKERSMAQLVAETSMARSCRIWTLMDFRERGDIRMGVTESATPWGFHLHCSSSSPLLSLVTSTSEISHQPVHTYTTYIQYDKGVDRTGRQGIEEKYSITWGRGGEKK